MVPEGWAVRSLRDVLERVVKPVALMSSKHYEQIGVRSHGKGIFVKEPVTGQEIGNKRVFWVEPNCLVVNIVFAWEQAVDVTAWTHKGKIASHRFPMYRPAENECDVQYLRYLFLTPRGKHLLRLASPGGAGRNRTLGQKEFERLAVPLPPLPEQKKIAEILSTWDKAIETTGKLLANAEAQKRALMQQLLTGKRRLPGFEGREWREEKLGEIAEIRRGASPRPISDARWFAETGRGWVRIADVTACSTPRLLATEQYLSEEGEERSVKVEPSELIMSICATIGVPRIVGIPVCIHDGFVVLRGYEERLDTEFLYFFLQKITRNLANSGQPGTQRNLNTGIVGRIMVPAISLVEQRQIASALLIAEEMIRSIQEYLKSLRLEKRALMQQLLTGTRRVTV